MYMAAGRSPAVIASLVGQELNHVQDTIRELKQSGVPYNRVKLHEKEADPGLTTATSDFRRRISNTIDRWSRETKTYEGDLSRMTGMTRKQLKRAGLESPIGQHDFRLSQLERLASAMGGDFRQFMLKHLLSDTEYAKVAACLSLAN